MSRLAARLAHLKPSATGAFLQKAIDLRSRGVDVVGLGVGEPDFDTPSHIIEAAQRALRDGQTRYTSTRGIAPLREAIAKDSASRRGGHAHQAQEIVVSVGAKHTLFNLCFALLGEGDEAIVPTPCWVSYPDQIELSGAKAALVPTAASRGFKLTPEELERAITPRTRALFLCTPCNPTGTAYSPRELSALAEVIRAHDFWIVVDEIYATLVYGGFDQRSLLEVAPDLRERLILVDGVSKRFAMTGFRIGWMLGPKAIADACEVIQSQTTTSPTSVAQYAALAALQGPNEPMETMRLAFDKRRAVALRELEAIAGIRCIKPDGAFYVFFDVREYLGRTLRGRLIDSDVALAELLLEEGHVALVPGAAFLMPGYMRMSYATSEAQIREGVARIARVLGS